jgi:hypothetical protein
VLVDVEEMEALDAFADRARGFKSVRASDQGAYSRAVAEFEDASGTIEMILQSSPGRLMKGLMLLFLSALDTSMFARELASSSLVVCGSPGILRNMVFPRRRKIWKITAAWLTGLSPRE